MLMARFNFPISSLHHTLIIKDMLRFWIVLFAGLFISYNSATGQGLIEEKSKFWNTYQMDGRKVSMREIKSYILHVDDTLAHHYFRSYRVKTALSGVTLIGGFLLVMVGIDRDLDYQTCQTVSAFASIATLFGAQPPAPCQQKNTTAYYVGGSVMLLAGVIIARSGKSDFNESLLLYNTRVQLSTLRNGVGLKYVF